MYIILSTLACSLLGLFFIYNEYQHFKTQPLDPAASSQPFTIKQGQNLSAIAKQLKRQHLIQNDRYFVWLVKLKRADKKLQAGEYLLSASKSPDQIIDTLLKGKVKLYKITFPEGLNMVEVADRIDEAGFCSKTDFLNLCKDSSYLDELGIKANSLEGFLFPDTYFFPNPVDCKTIINTMTDRFKQIFSQKWERRAEQMGFSTFEILTLASIIEKETGDASERPIISSVFHNRLTKKMRLESDPTVIYGIKDFDGNIKRKHLRMLTPYNTYRIKGLPMGPIANPGALSIEAALYPSKTDYLFFVSKKDTTHYFSKTIKEHNRAVRKYQLNKK